MSQKPLIRHGTAGLPYCVGFLLALGIAARHLHLEALDPTNVRWLLTGDWAPGYLGWNAFRREPWQWPLGHMALLAWPNGVSVIFTDSNPLLALPLKLIAPLLPDQFQYTGPWLALCMILQFHCAYLLARHATADRWIRVLIAVLMAMTPALLNRFWHPTLCAHWTILLSLHIYLNKGASRYRYVYWSLLLTVSIAIHPYFLVMNGAIMLAAVLRDLARAGRGRVRRAVWIAGASLLAGVVPLLVFGMLGGFSGATGEGGGFGYFGMAADALINPGVAGYSRLLPVTPGGTFEGFQYLGAGLLGIVFFALCSLVLIPEARHQLRRMGWVAWLLPTLLALSLFALSSKPNLAYNLVAELVPYRIWAALRASGRFFWPCTYVLILASAELLARNRRGVTLALLGTALFLQLYDLTDFSAAVRSRTMAASTAVRPGLLRSEGQWRAVMSNSRLVEVQPPGEIAKSALFNEVAWLATTLGRPVNMMYTAREYKGQAAWLTARRRDFLMGRLDPASLYILTDGRVPARIGRDRLRMIDGVLIIPPAGLSPRARNSVQPAVR